VGNFSDGKAAVSVLNRDRIADAMVERFVVEPQADGPLRGSSFAVKDLFDVAGWPTGCGNPAWRATHSSPKTSAAVIGQLLRAGARLVGKTCTDELAYSLEGRNYHEGAPINPAAPDRLTGGSSSGAASAVAAGDVDFAVASDTAGSVRVPAAWCGLAGIRPTHGRVSVAGLTALAPSFDTVGWLSRSTALLRQVGGVIFAKREAPSPGITSRDIPASAITLVRDPSVDSRAAKSAPAALARLREHRAAQKFGLADVSLNIDLEWAATCLSVLQAREAWESHGPWIQVVDPCFGPGVAERFAAARNITEAQLREAGRQRAAVIACLDAVLPAGRILCLPTAPAPAPRRDASVEELQLQRTRLLPLTCLASLSGRPQITLPWLKSDGAPMGLSLLGWRDGDEALLQMAELLSSPC
jgi:amidase